MMNHFVRAGALALLCAGSLSGAASARTPYDGQWSLLVVTEKGSCDRAYRYGVQVNNGVVQYGGGAVNLSGRVAPNGAVRVSISSGGASATGSGHLSRNSGSGHWSGRGSQGLCSGTWSAERRG